MKYCTYSYSLTEEGPNMKAQEKIGAPKSPIISEPGSNERLTGNGNEVSYASS